MPGRQLAGRVAVSKASVNLLQLASACKPIHEKTSRRGCWSKKWYKTPRQRENAYTVARIRLPYGVPCALRFYHETPFFPGVSNLVLYCRAPDCNHLQGISGPKSGTKFFAYLITFRGSLWRSHPRWCVGSASGRRLRCCRSSRKPRARGSRGRGRSVGWRAGCARVSATGRAAPA